MNSAPSYRAGHTICDESSIPQGQAIPWPGAAEQATDTARAEVRMVERILQLLPSIPFRNVERGRMLSCIQMLIAATFLAAVGVMSVASIRYARSGATKELVTRGTIVTSIISRAAARALEQTAAADWRAALYRVIYDIRAEEGLEFAFILDSRERALAHSFGSKEGTVISGFDVVDPQAREGWTDDGFYYTVRSGVTLPGDTAKRDTVFEFVRPITLDAAAREKLMGNLELHLGFALPGFWSFAGASLKRLIPGLAVAFLMLIIGNYMAGVLVRPLRMLKDETASAAKASDEWQLEVEATGEIADIARNWNEMVENFRGSYKNVVEARRELEVRNRVMLYEKKRTEAIVDGLSDGVVVIDAYGKISSLNREGENLLDITREDAASRAPRDVIKDQPVLDFIAPILDSPEDRRGKASGSQTKKAPRRVADLEVQRKNGSRHLRVTCTPVLNANQAPGGVITVLRDITQERLEEKARKDFVSSVTHELRAPLTAIKSYVEMLIDNEAKDPNLQREFFNTINEEADRLARLIDDMLNMSNIEVGNMVLNKSLVRTRKLVEDAVNGVRSAAKNKSIELSVSIAEDLPDIEADKEMLRVVVTNLLGNGIKYTQDGGQVFLSAELVKDPGSASGNGMIAVTVADNGPGIPDDEQDKIFEKFYRAKGAREQKVAGNGLGLALAREIATLHGGDIKLTSKEGEGSKFAFLLPAAKTSRKVS